jgi:hypothetical protein
MGRLWVLDSLGSHIGASRPADGSQLDHFSRHNRPLFAIWSRWKSEWKPDRSQHSKGAFRFKILY